MCPANPKWKRAITRCLSLRWPEPVETAKRTVPPIGHVASYRWVVLAVGVLCQTGISIPGQGIPSLAYFLQQDMALSRAQVGMFSTAIALGATLSLIASGVLADRIGVRQLLLIGQVLIGIFVVLMGFSNSFPLALLTLVPVGLGSGMINPAITKAIMYWFAPRVRGTAMSLKQTGVPIGGAVAAATLPSLAIAFGWHTAVMFLGIAIAASGIACFILYREYQEPAKTATAPSKTSFRHTLRLLTSRDVLIASAVSTPLVVIQFSVVTYFLLYLKEVLLLPVIVAGVYLSITQLSGIAGRIFWGVVSDYFFKGSRRKTMLVITGVGVAACAATAALPVGAPVWLIFALAVGLGGSSLSWHGVYMAQIGELAGKELAGTAVGFSLTATQLGIIFGPPLFGYIVDSSGNYRIAWLVMAAFSAGGAALLVALREQRQPA